MKRSGISKLKQRTAEWFNKNKKTVDQDFERQRKSVSDQVSQMRSLFAHVRAIFSQIEDLLLQADQMGKCLQILYSDSAKLKPVGDRLAGDLAANKQVIERH